jgi:serine/threonine-protein kinase
MRRGGLRDAGRQPFQGESELSTAELILKEEPIPLTHFRPDIPGELDAIIMRSLQKRPEDRPQTAQELVQGCNAIS